MEPATVRKTPDNPTNGDLILHCGHVLTVRKHCFYAPDGIRYKRPDPDNPGERVDAKAHWVVCCPDCHEKCGGDPSKLKIKGDGIWQGKK